MSDYIVDGSDLTSIANAIRTKGGTSESLEFPSGFVSAIGNINRGGDTPVPEKDVVYIDYDGSILYSYTAAEFANFSAHPDHPTPPYSWLTADDWNWTLASAKTYVSKYKQLVIGQSYTPANDAIFIVIDIPLGRDVSVAVKSNANSNSITVDWGDSSTPDTQTANNNVSVTFTHTYSSAGEYHIKLTHSGKVTTEKRLVYAGNLDPAGISYVKDIFIGTNVGFPSNAFRYFTANIGLGYGLTGTSASLFCDQFFEGIVLPKGYLSTTGNSNWFSGCQTAKYISLPESFVGSGRNYVFSNCKSLRKACTDDSETWNSGVFNSCYSLARINVPACVTAIKASTFADCFALLELHFYGSTPPTVENSNAFYRLPDSCKIYVPSGKLSDYTTASSYPDPNTYTYVEE